MDRFRYFLLFFLAPFLNSHAKIYDCFLFYNELEILTIRLHELYDHVDKFVVVESQETFRGNPKPLYYEENKHLFEKFADKIIHIIIAGHYEPQNKKEYWKVWEREHFQRDQIMRGLIECADEDIILISDVDEILRAQSIHEIQKMMQSIPATISYKWIACKHTYYSYFFNRHDPKFTPWIGTMAVCYKDLKKYSPQYFRTIRLRRPFNIENAGWHFSYMGGFERVVDKLSVFSHSEWDTPENRDRENMRKKIDALPLVAIDESFPRIIYENQEEYIKKGFIDVPNK